MAVTAETAASTFPVDWSTVPVDGEPFDFDPMHTPWPISPLEASILGPAFNHGFAIGMREMGVPVVSSDRIFPNHFLYWRVEMAPPPAGPEGAELAAAAEATGRREVGRMMDRWRDEHRPRVLAHNARLKQIDLHVASDDEVDGLLDEIEAILRDLWTVHFRIAGVMLASVQAFSEFHADLFGGTEADAHPLLAGAMSESIRAGFGLSDLAARARALGLESLLLATPPTSLEATLAASDAGRSFLDDLDAYLDVYGYRQDLYQLTMPTWREAHEIPLAYVQSHLRTGHDARLHHARVSHAAEAARQAAREGLATYPEPVREQFEGMLARARDGAFLQEEHNYYIDQYMTALVRIAMLGLGQRLVDAGTLDRADDVFMLELGEARALAGGDGEAIGGARNLVARRREEMAIAATLTPPPRIGAPAAGVPPLASVGMRAMANFFGRTPRAADRPGELHGHAASRGIASGSARVARTLAEAQALRAGEILVAVTTMPPWTPLFGIAAAVVTETGGALSHCAIVAREYGVPAVVGVAGATTAIRTGQRLTVDGAMGVVLFGDDAQEGQD